jgi:hypothetical protein
MTPKNKLINITKDKTKVSERVFPKLWEPCVLKRLNNPPLGRDCIALSNVIINLLFEYLNRLMKNHTKNAD